MHLVRLASYVPRPCAACVPALLSDEVIDADGFSPHGAELYELRDNPDTMTRTITLHRPGDPTAADVSFTVPAGRGFLYANDDGNSDVFVYFVLDSSTSQYDVYRRDQKHHRSFPLPPGMDPRRLDDQTDFDFLLTADGSRLVVHETDGQMTAYSTLDDSAVPLGMRPSTFLIDNAHAAVLTVGADGFRSVPLDGSPERVLSPMTFDFAGLVIEHDQDAYYGSGGLWRVPLDGSAPPVLVQSDGARLLTLGPHGEIVYSRDPADTFVGGAGDGWVGGRRFMERGAWVRFGDDGIHIRFLEHAATVNMYGNLTSVALPDGAPFTLGLNVINYAELPDHRVLALENAVLPGNWNRLVVIDEAARTKHWVVPEAVDFILVPGGREIIADVVTGASGYDIVRLPAP